VEGTPNVEIAHDGVPSGVRTLTLKRDRGEGLLPVQGRTCPAHCLTHTHTYTLTHTHTLTQSYTLGRQTATERMEPMLERKESGALRVLVPSRTGVGSPAKSERRNGWTSINCEIIGVIMRKRDCLPTLIQLECFSAARRKGRVVWCTEDEPTSVNTAPLMARNRGFDLARI
jgi:hypothetical protein